MTAIFSPCRTWRYTLERPVRDQLFLDKEFRSILWVMLNPSTADEERDDPTIKTCKAFSQLWGFDHMLVGNLFSYRLTDPHALWRAHQAGKDIVGPQTDEHLNQLLLRADRVVLAWGAHADKYPKRAEAVERMLARKKELFALGFTKAGHPRHPLYQPHDLTLQHVERVDA